MRCSGTIATSRRTIRSARRTRRCRPRSSNSSTSWSSAPPALIGFDLHRFAGLREALSQRLSSSNCQLVPEIRYKAGSLPELRFSAGSPGAAVQPTWRPSRSSILERGWGMKSGSRCHGRVAAVGSVKGPSRGPRPTGESHRFSRSRDRDRVARFDPLRSFAPKFCTG
jgi:hypothetical protein